MIEIEVEMDTNVLAAEATSNVVNITMMIWILSLPWENDAFHWENWQFDLQEIIAKQIQQIMELENLEEVCLRFHIT